MICRGHTELAELEASYILPLGNLICTRIGHPRRPAINNELASAVDCGGINSCGSHTQWILASVAYRRVNRLARAIVSRNANTSRCLRYLGSL